MLGEIIIGVTKIAIGVASVPLKIVGGAYEAVRPVLQATGIVDPVTNAPNRSEEEDTDSDSDENW